MGESKLKSIFNHKLFGILLAGFLGSLFTIGINWICNQINANENYLEFANRNKPIFKIISEPKIDSIIILNDSSYINHFVKDQKRIFPFSHRFHIPKSLMKMTISFTIENMSNVPGQYLGHSVWMFNNDNANLRDSLINKRMNAKIIDLSSDALFNKRREASFIF